MEAGGGRPAGRRTLTKTHSPAKSSACESRSVFSFQQVQTSCYMAREELQDLLATRGCGDRVHLNGSGDAGGQQVPKQVPEGAGRSQPLPPPWGGAGPELLTALGRTPAGRRRAPGGGHGGDPRPRLDPTPRRH